MLESLRPVIGIDPGISRVGYGVIGFRRDSTIEVYDKGVIKTDSKDSLAVRLDFIYSGLEEVIKKHSPQSSAIEKIFFAHNHQAILKLAQARGVAVLACARNCMPLCEYSPQEIKKAVVGNGKATKEQVQYMVRLLLNLKSIPKPADMADALAIAICHIHSMNTNKNMVYK